MQDTVFYISIIIFTAFAVVITAGAVALVYAVYKTIKDDL